MQKPDHQSDQDRNPNQALLHLASWVAEVDAEPGIPDIGPVVEGAADATAERIGTGTAEVAVGMTMTGTASVLASRRMVPFLYGFLVLRFLKKKKK